MHDPINTRLIGALRGRVLFFSARGRSAAGTKGRGRQGPRRAGRRGPRATRAGADPAACRALGAGPARRAAGRRSSEGLAALTAVAGDASGRVSCLGRALAPGAARVRGEAARRFGRATWSAAAGSAVVAGEPSGPDGPHDVACARVRVLCARRGHRGGGPRALRRSTGRLAFPTRWARLSCARSRRATCGPRASPA